MRSILAIGACLASMVYGSADTFSKHRVDTFYETYLCAEKNKLYSAGVVSTPCTLVPGGLGPFTPPVDPPPPPHFVNGFVPVILVNNSGYPDSEVWVLVTGNTVPGGAQAWGNINTSSGIVTLQPVAGGDNGSSFSVSLAQLPLSTAGRVFYMPQITSGLIWFSMVNKLNMPVVMGAIQQPAFTTSTDPNYYTNYDIFEFTYLLAGNPQVNADATAVSFFSIPLYGYLAGATSVANHTGLYQPRCYVMSQCQSVINANAKSPEITQWDKLFLTSGGNILRFVSTGKAIAASIFDINYLDNAAAYGYSYLSDIWYGLMSYYTLGNHTLTMDISVTSPSSANYTYTGNYSAGLFTFNSMDAGAPSPISFAPISTTGATTTTSFYIFSDINLFKPTLPYPTAGTAQDVISRLFEEAVIAGILPTTNTISLNSIESQQANYYQVNPNLSVTGQSTGPWYDLYSKALHSVGSIYTSGFDETLWPQVLLGGPYVNGSTYLGITIGNVTQSCQ